MTRIQWSVTTLVGVLLLALGSSFFVWHRLVSAAVTVDEATGITFRYLEIDNRAGDLKMVGDMDGDGKLDLVLGGMLSEGLNWYHNPDWTRTQVAIPGNEFTTDGALGDIDGDGDLDIVAPDGDGADSLRWFENPRPAKPASDASAWTLHTVGTPGSWVKDVELADFDGDEHMDIAGRTNDSAFIFFQTEPNVWSRQTFANVRLGNEGMGSGDVNADGWIDLVLRGTWVRNPGGTAARDISAWTEYSVGDGVDTDFKTVVADINSDHNVDLLFSSSENTADVIWFTPTTGDPTKAWTPHVIAATMERTHTLQVADMNRDGKMDVVLAQMHTSAAQEAMVYFNLDGQGTSWRKFVFGDNGLHNGVVADIDGNGYPDLYGANWTGNPPVKLWLNEPQLWTYKQVSAANERSFGLAAGDVNADGNTDIVAGRYWYRTPGGSLLGDWLQSPLPDGMHGSLSLDVDGDQRADVIAQKDEGDIGLYWLELQPDGSWFSHQIGTVPRASHELGAQGYKVGQIVADGKPEVAFSSGQGIFYFSIPSDPTGGLWPRTQVNANPSDEGLSLGDVDGDGNLDVAATTGDSKRVEWYRNPGDGSANWVAFQIGNFNDAVYPDRTELADLNGDGKLDIVVTEENTQPTEAKTCWWLQPADPTSANWERRLVTTQGSTNSLDVADLNRDGHQDLILAEHKGSLKLAVWLNDGQGDFTEQVIDQDKESHLGAQAIDMDGDGDLDIVSIAYDDVAKVHLWRNDGPVDMLPDPTPTTTRSATASPVTPVGTDPATASPVTPVGTDPATASPVTPAGTDPATASPVTPVATGPASVATITPKPTNPAVSPTCCTIFLPYIG